MVAVRLALVIAVSLAVLAACADDDDDEAAPATALEDSAITVGSFDFPESVLLAEIYSQALERAGSTSSGRSPSARASSSGRRWRPG